MPEIAYQYWYSVTYQAHRLGHIQEAKRAAVELQQALDDWFNSSAPWHGTVSWQDMAFLVTRVQEQRTLEDSPDGEAG